MVVRAERLKTTIVGAGPAGTLLAIFLARQGVDVEVYERRGDVRREPVERGRSINLTLAARGLDALERAGILDAIMRLVVPLRGRVIHPPAQPARFQPYGRRSHELTYAIRRSDLQAALLTAAEAFPSVRIRFKARCLEIERDRGLAHLRDECTGEAFTSESHFIVGADGAFSALRPLMQAGVEAVYQQEVHSHGYKELTIPASLAGRLGLADDALHVWPRDDSMLIAIPNLDGSFTGTCILSHGHGIRLSGADAGQAVFDFFAETFADALPLVPDLAADFQRNPFSQFVSTRTAPWHYRDRVVLVGDACHAVYPFLGQGMNAAFEDCVVLTRSLLGHPNDRTRAFVEYEQARKRNTDALDFLSRQHLFALRDQVRAATIARNRIYDLLGGLAPAFWRPLYTLITHTTMPYADVVERWRWQERVARSLGVDVLVYLYGALLFLRERGGTSLSVRGAHRLIGARR
jgi:kynurenine 3-monooxygenase